jgi:DNA repair exonuclease SbcCD ATPase subunit
MRPCRLLTVSLVFLVSGSAGCSLFQRTPQPTTGPFFSLDDPQDSERIQTLRREADQLLMTCSAAGSCDRAHHLRGLTALYEDRAEAADEFQAALATASTRERAESSRFWLGLLDETANAPGADGAFSHATARLLRDLLAAELVTQQLTKHGQQSEKEAQQLQKELQQLQKEAQQLRKERETTLVQSLQRELKSRDKKIEDLTAQLGALKEIEREMRRKSPPAPSLEKTPLPAKKGTP